MYTGAIYCTSNGPPTVRPTLLTATRPTVRKANRITAWRYEWPTEHTRSLIRDPSTEMRRKKEINTGLLKIKRKWIKTNKKVLFFYKDSPLPFDFQSLIIAQTGKFRKYVRFLSLIRSHRVEKIPKKNNRTCAIIRDSIVQFPQQQHSWTQGSWSWHFWMKKKLKMLLKLSRLNCLNQALLLSRRRRKKSRQPKLDTCKVLSFRFYSPSNDSSMVKIWQSFGMSSSHRMGYGVCVCICSLSVKSISKSIKNQRDMSR